MPILMIKYNQCFIDIESMLIPRNISGKRASHGATMTGRKQKKTFKPRLLYIYQIVLFCANTAITVMKEAARAYKEFWCRQEAHSFLKKQ